MIQNLINFNQELTIYLHKQIVHNWFLEIMVLFSKYIGNFKYAPISFSLILVAMFFYIQRSKNKKQAFYASARCFTVMIFSLFLAAIIIKFLKHYFASPRPFCNLPIKEVIHLAMHKSEKCFRSFPSGHAAYTSTIFFSLCPIMNIFTRILGGVAAVTILTSRISLAMHFPIDVVTSTIICLGIVTLGFKLYPLLEKIFSKPLKKLEELLT